MIENNNNSKSKTLVTQHRLIIPSNSLTETCTRSTSWRVQQCYCGLRFRPCLRILFCLQLWWGTETKAKAIILKGKSWHWCHFTKHKTISHINWKIACPYVCVFSSPTLRKLTTKIQGMISPVKPTKNKIHFWPTNSLSNSRI